MSIFDDLRAIAKVAAKDPKRFGTALGNTIKIPLENKRLAQELKTAETLANTGRLRQSRGLDGSRYFNSAQRITQNIAKQQLTLADLAKQSRRDAVGGGIGTALTVLGAGSLPGSTAIRGVNNFRVAGSGAAALGRMGTVGAIGTGINTGISMALNPKADLKTTARQSAIQSFGNAPKYAGVNTLTNPLVSRVMGGINPTSMKARTLAGGATNAVANVAEDEILKYSEEGRLMNPSETLGSAGTGFVFGAATQVLPTLKAKEEADKSLQNVLDSLRKSTPGEIAKANDMAKMHYETHKTALFPNTKKYSNDNVNAIGRIIGEYEDTGKLSKDTRRELEEILSGHIKKAMLSKMDDDFLIRESFYQVNNQIKQGGFVKPDEFFGIKTKKFEAPYKRGDIGKIQGEIDKALGIDEGLSYKQKFAAEQAAREHLEYEAGKGNVEAQKYKALIDNLDEQLATARTRPGTQPTKGEAEPLNPSGNSLLKSRIKDINANLPDGQKIEVPESKFGKFDEITRRVLDEYGPVKKVGKLATKQGAELRSLDDPEILVKRNLGAGGIAEGELYGMGDIIKPYKDEMDSLGEYLIAKRQVADLAERGVEAGKDLDTSKQIVEQYGPRYEKVANQLYMYQRSILYNYLVDTGVLSEKSFKQIIDKNPNYVPYKRLFEEAGVSQLYAGKQNPVKGIKGSKREILNPFESMIENTYKAVAFGEQNRLWRSVGRIGDQFPDIGITKVKPKMAKVANVDGKNIYRPSTFNPEPNTISYFEDGKRVFYKVPPEISKVANNMGSMNNILMDIMSYPTKVIRTGATGANPEFGLFRNPLRDQFTALWNSESGYIPFVDMMRGISHYAGDDDLYRQYLLSGADQSYMTSLDQEFKSKTLNQLLKESDFSGFKGVANKIKDQKGLLGKLQEVNQFSESGTRLGEFEKALKKSGDPYEAARAAREVTVDFATIGKDTRAANRLIPFLNASVQGTIRSVKSAIKHPKRSGFLGVALGSLPATVLYIHNRMYPEYQDIEDWEKQNNWIVMTGEPGNSTPISIPKDFIMGKLFGSTTEHFLSWVDQNDPQALSKIAQTMAEFASPVTGVGDALPSIAKPIIEDQFNYNSFLENQIVPDYMKGRPPEAQYDKGTREVAKIIGSRLGVSPKRIDNLLYGYFPGVFSEAINLVDFALGGKKFEDATKLPFARVFLVSGTGKIDREIKDSYFKIQDIKNQMSSVQKSTTYSESEKKAYLDSMIKEIGVETQNINRYMELQQGISPEQNTAEKAPTVPYQPKGLATKAEASNGLVIPSDPQELKMFKENIKTKIDYGEPTDKELEYYYLYDALKMPSKNRYETALKEDSLWGAVGKIEKDESLPPEQQAQLIKKVADEMGLKPAHIAYQRVARQNNDKKTLFAMDRLDNAKTDKERMDILVSGRLFVDGDYILSNGVIDNLVDEGYIDYGEGETLKKMKIDPKTGKAIQTGRLKKGTKSSSSKSGKAVTGLKTYKSTPVQFGGSKLPTLRLTL